MFQQNPQKPLEIQHTALGYKIYQYDTVSSTNNIAKEIAKKSDEEKIVVLAETQTSGKGRLGRQWVSPKGGLWLSIILRPEISPKETLKLTFIAASAVAKTLKTKFALKAEIKWPNDILVNNRKISGILIETSIKENTIEFVVIGVGINTNIDLKSLPNNLRDVATSVKHELGYYIEQKTLTKNFLQYFESRYKRLQRGLWSILLQEWKAMATFLGEQVEVTSFDEVFIGKALDVDEDGGLIIRLENGALKKILIGDVTLKKKL